MDMVNELIGLGTAAMNLAAAALGAGMAWRALKRRRSARGGDDARDREQG
ncbi:hypothetical protein [Streptomyces sp. NPDC051183]